MQGQSFRLIHLSEETFQNFAPQYASIEGFTTYEHRLPIGRKDGSIVWCSVSWNPMDSKDPGKGHVWTLLDITALPRPRPSSAGSRPSFEQSLDLRRQMTRGLEGNITFVNRGFCITSGYETQEVLRKNRRVLKSRVRCPRVYKASTCRTTLPATSLLQGPETASTRMVDAFLATEQAVFHRVARRHRPALPGKRRSACLSPGNFPSCRMDFQVRPQTEWTGLGNRPPTSYFSPNPYLSPMVC